MIKKILIVLLALLFAISVSIYIVRKNPSLIWFYVKDFSGIAVGNNQLARIISDQVGGIKILPTNYQPQKKDVKIEIFDLKTKQKKIYELFKQVDESTGYSFLADPKNNTVWIVQQVSQMCRYDNKLRKIVTDYNLENDCRSYLWQFDSVTHQLGTPMKIANFADTYLRLAPIQPLAVDNNKNIWLSLREEIPNNLAYHLVLFDTSKKEMKMWFNTYDIYSSRYSPYSDGFVASQMNSGFVGNDNNLYYLSKNSSKNLQSDQLNVTKTNGGAQPIQIPISMVNETWYFGSQMVLDKQTNKIYIVDRTWDGNENSQFFEYDISKRMFTPMGGNPGRINDDVRGVSLVKGSLLIGMFDGLGVYNQTSKNWNIVGKNYGLFENAVRTIQEISPDRFCLNHESNNMSCLKVPFSLFKLIFRI